MTFAAFVRYLLLPTRPVGVVFIACFTAGLLLAQKAGLLGIPLALILLSWLFKYAYVLLDHVAEGAREPPVLSIEMMNPADEQRPIGQLFIALAVGSAIAFVRARLGTALADGLTLLALLALPASVASFAVTRSFVQAVNPLTLWRIARGFGWIYLAVTASAVVFGLVVTLLARADLPQALGLAVALFGWLSLFALLGGGLYERREALGLEATHAPERAQARESRETGREHERFIDGVYGQARSGNLQDAWRTIEQRLGARAHADEAYAWLLDRLDALEDPRLADRLAQAFVSRLLARDNAKALRVVEQRLAWRPGFRPRTAAETLRVAELASLSGHRASARALLADFGRRFPADAAAPQAAALAERLARR
jgi:hypothetical protein